MLPARRETRSLLLTQPRRSSQGAAHPILLVILSRREVIATSIWVIGWAIAIPVYFLASSDDADPLYDYRHSKSYENSVERFGGKAALFGQRLTEWLTDLVTGPMLGVTIAVLSTVCALAYLWWTRPRNRSRARGEDYQ